jgi:hypothetical protein
MWRGMTFIQSITQPVINKHNYLTPWRIIVLEDLILAQPVKKFHVFYGT